MGRSSEGSGVTHSSARLMPRTRRAVRPAGRHVLAQEIACGRLRQACGKVSRPLHGVNHFVSLTQHYGGASRLCGDSWLSCPRECAKNAQFSTRYRQLLKASTKCHSSTAENSPNLSWTSRSDHSRKIQLVLRCRSPLAKCSRPRTAPGATSGSGWTSMKTSHRSSPRFSSPMCLARSCPGNGALMDRRTTPRRHVPRTFALNLVERGLVASDHGSCRVHYAALRLPAS